MEKKIRRKRIRAVIIALTIIGIVFYAIYNLDVEKADYHKALGDEIIKVEAEIEKHKDDNMLLSAVDKAKQIYSDDTKVYEDYKKAYEELKKAEKGKKAIGEEKESIKVFLEIRLSESIDASEGRYILRKDEYVCEKGSSVLDVLYKECRNHNIQLEMSADSTYVEGIGGEYEFDAGSGSGWMFSVNGEYPMLSCQELKVEEGDYILWEYVSSEGENLYE